MAASLVRCINGSYVNLDCVRIVAREDATKGTYRIITDTGSFDIEEELIDQHIVSTVTVQGDWECLRLMDIEDEKPFLTAVPVIAWGRKLFGPLVPITADSPSGVYELPYALRKSTGPQVFAFGSEEPFQDADAWLAFVTKKKAHSA